MEEDEVNRNVITDYEINLMEGSGDPVEGEGQRKMGANHEMNSSRKTQRRRRKNRWGRKNHQNGNGTERKRAIRKKERGEREGRKEGQT